MRGLFELHSPAAVPIGPYPWDPTDEPVGAFEPVPDRGRSPADLSKGVLLLAHGLIASR
jgi:hypothetical protein